MSENALYVRDLSTSTRVLSDARCTQTTPPTREQCISSLIEFLAEQAVKTAQ